MIEDDDPPSKPGTKPIPEGHMRRFHVTPTKNIPSIRKHGLTMDHAQGTEGPRAIYSHTSFKDAQQYGSGEHASIVEFHHHPDHYKAHPYATTEHVKPEHILAIHHHWHEVYHMAKDENVPIERMRKLKNHGPTYAKTLEYMEKEQKK